MKKRLVLLDGHAIAYRAYHALPPLTSRGGQLVNAVYGFASMLLKTIDDLKPTHLAVAFDLPVPTFRHEAYIAYQAKRPEMDREMSDQIKLIHELVEAAGIPIYTAAGFEADDVIGTLAAQATEGKWEVGNEKIDNEMGSGKSHISRQNPASHLSHRTSNIEVVIVTGDRDMMQLVDKKVKVYAPIKGLSEARLFDSKEVKEYMGVAPSQIVDYKALMGDSADNYPGVPGIGPKTASALLREFGSLDNLYTALKSKIKNQKSKILSEGIVKKLEEGYEAALLSQKLAKIVTDAPVELDLEHAKLGDIQKNEKFIEKLREFGFRSLIKRVTGEEEPKSKSKSKRKGNGHRPGGRSGPEGQIGLL